MGEARTDIDPALAKNKQLYLRYSHDDVFQLYVNGMQLVSTGYEWKSDLRVNIPDSIAETMKDGKAVLPLIVRIVWEVHWLTSDYMQN